MKNSIKLTLFIFILGFNLFGQEDNPWKSWEEGYNPMDYSDLIEHEKNYADSIENNPSIAPYFFRVDTYKIIGKYLGKKRPIKEEVLASMKRVFKLTIGDPSQLDELIYNEVLFEIEGTEVWMPIQQQLETPLKEEINKGTMTVLYCLFLNEHTFDKELYNTLLISEFRPYN